MRSWVCILDRLTHRVNKDRKTVYFVLEWESSQVNKCGLETFITYEKMHFNHSFIKSSSFRKERFPMCRDSYTERHET